MSALTAGAVTDKISELRSKIAIYETLISQVEANYLSSDAGPGELRIQRHDGAMVNDKHFKITIVELKERIETISEELIEWENLIFVSAKEATETAPKETPKLEAKLKEPKEEKSNVVAAAKRSNPSQSAAK